MHKMQLQISPAQQKMSLNIDSFSPWEGALGVLGVHLHILPVNYA